MNSLIATLKPIQMGVFFLLFNIRQIPGRTRGMTKFYVNNAIDVLLSLFGPKMPLNKKKAAEKQKSPKQTVTHGGLAEV